MNRSLQSWLRNILLLSALILPACQTPEGTGSQSGALLGSGLACTVDADCLGGEECDDQVCHLHSGDGVTGEACTSNADCDVGFECEDGACAPHGGDDATDDNGTDPAGTDDNGTDPAGTDDNGTDPAGTDDNGTDTSGTDDNGGAGGADDGGVACASDADCAAGEKCKSGTCEVDDG
ncbi:MAG: hypothetical protein IPK82_30490 [Polyangiaceae bacterium]|nr:hypothetical protein [Polyangiaceae bacterium]